MNDGRRLREKYKRGDFYALLAINAINEKRTLDNDEAQPLRRFVHVIRSLKRPDEVETLRRVYGEVFSLACRPVLKAADAISPGKREANWCHGQEKMPNSESR